MNVTLPLEEMTVEDKLRVMEVLWNDLSRHEADIPSPDWHGQVLREREARLRTGEEQFMDWEEAKQQLRDRVKRPSSCSPPRCRPSPAGWERVARSVG